MRQKFGVSQLIKKKHENSVDKRIDLITMAFTSRLQVLRKVKLFKNLEVHRRQLMWAVDVRLCTKQSMPIRSISCKFVRRAFIVT